MVHSKNLLLRLISFLLFYFYFFLILANDRLKISINNSQNKIYFDVELAETWEQRKKGLMFRKNLDKNKGMLFIFPNESFIKMWMKNTMIPLDIIFFSKERVVVDIIENAKKMSDTIIISKVKAKYALEINSGLVKKLNINLGDNINFEKKYSR